MTFPLYYSPEAEEDIFAITDYLGDIDSNLPLHFLDALDATADLLKQHPQAGAIRTFNNPLLADMRMFPITDFGKYVLYYRFINDTVEVIAIYHGARDAERLFAKPE